VPTYNRKEDLKKCITALVNQTYPKDKFEIMICDDSSTDGTKDLVYGLMSKNRNILYLQSKENLGDGHARNLGLKKSKGEIIAFTDDDCEPTPSWIEKGVNYFEKNDSLTGLQGKTLPVEEIDTKKKIFHYARTINISEQDLNSQTCNMFYRKSDLIDIGGFDEEIRFVNDVDISNRLLEWKKKILFGNEVLVRHKVEYLPFFKYLLRMSVHQYYPLLIKKNPSIRNRLYLKIFVKKSHIYPIFIILSIISFILRRVNIFFEYVMYLSMVLFVITFLYGRVITDGKLSAYPIRLISIIRYFILDITDMFFLLKGSLKHKIIVL
jgi:glycosyltransferase involved in cell wall biosynthesis